MSRRWLFPSKPSIFVILVTTALALAGGAILLALRASVYEATARIAVAANPEAAALESVSRDAPPGARRAVLTEIEVLRSDAVLNLAAQKLRLDSTEALRESLSAIPVTGPEVLIKVRRTAPPEAALWTNTIANAYVEFRRASIEDNAAATTVVISRAVEEDNRRIGELRTQIASNPPEAEALRTEERQLSARVEQLQKQLASLDDARKVATGGAKVLDLAQTPMNPVRPAWLRDLGTAAVLGVITGGALSIMPEPKRLRRPRHRGTGPNATAVAPGMDSEAPAPLTASPAYGVVEEAVQIPAVAPQIPAGAYAPAGEPPSEPTPSPDPSPTPQQPDGADPSLALPEADSAIIRQLQMMHHEFEERLAAQHADIANRVDWVAARLYEDSTRVPTKLEELLQGFDSHLAAERDSVNAALERTRRGVLDEVHEDRLQSAKRMAELNYEMLQRFGKVALKLHQELQATRSEMDVRLSAYGAHFADGLDTLATTWKNHHPALAARLQSELRQIRSQLSSQEEVISKAFDGVRRGILDKVEEDRAQIEERVAEQSNDVVQKIAKIGFVLDQDLERLREESSEKTAGTQEVLASLRQSLESKLHLEAMGFAGQMSGMLNQLTAHSKLIETKIAEAVGHLNANLVQKADMDRAELVQRVATLDLEVSRRLGHVVGRLSEALAALRTEVSERLSSSESAIAAMLESSEGKRSLESSELATQLSRVSEGFGSNLTSLEARLVDSTEEMKQNFEQSSQADLDQLVENLRELDRQAADRLEKLSASVKRNLRDLRTRVSEEMISQHSEVDARLKSLEGKLARKAAAGKEPAAGDQKKPRAAVTDISARLQRRSSGPRPAQTRSKPEGAKKPTQRATVRTQRKTAKPSAGRAKPKTASKRSAIGGRSAGES